MAEESKPDFAWLPAGTEALADGEYDAIVLGTGLKECIISGLLAVNGQKVLHMDRNAYYGGDCASLNLSTLYEKFKPGQSPPSELGSNRDYNIDLIPKFIMACGKLVKMLLHTKVTRYLEFKNVDGSYVCKNGKTYKVPATGEEALKSSLMGMFEKRKFRKLLMYIYNVEEDDAKTFEGVDLFTAPMSEVYEKYGVDANTQSFMGHAMALMRDESYVHRPAIETVRAIKLYAYSLERYGKSPYLYPIYGLGGLPEGFSHAHFVAAEGMYVAIVSTMVETDDPLQELEAGVALLGPYLARFDSVSDMFEPLEDGHKDNCYISKSYDATSHFETTSDDVLDMYKRITGVELDMNINADTTEAD